MNPFLFRGPIPPNYPTAIRREVALKVIVEHIESLSAYPAIMSARQTGKTSLLHQLSAQYEDRFAFVLLDFQGWRDVNDLKALYGWILRRLATALPNASERLMAANPKNGPDFQEELTKAAASCDKHRLVVVCDELGGLEADVAKSFAGIVRAIFHEKQSQKGAERITFVLAGGIDLALLATGVSSPLYNVVEYVYLDDFAIDDVKRIAAAGNLLAAADGIYAQTSGHPYLTQRLLWYASPANYGLSVGNAVDRLIDDGDPCIGTTLRHLESSFDSVKSLAKRIFGGAEVRFNRSTSQIRELEFIGLIKRGSNGNCMPRNEILRRVVGELSGQDHVEVTYKILTNAVPTGCYHNLDPIQFPLLQVHINNGTASDVRISVAAEIPSYSDRDIRGIHLASHDAVVVTLMPRLNREKIAGLNEITHSSLNVSVKRLDIGSTIHEEVHDIWLHARDTALLALVDPETSALVVDLTHHLCAWVTPRANGVSDVLRRALNRHPERIFSGYSDDRDEDDSKAHVRAQVQAIYETLQRDYTIGYISSTVSFGAEANQINQRVQLPAQTLTSATANCLDGAVLFASLLEGIELNPVLVLMAGHAYVGWEVAPGSGAYEYIETTMVRTEPFREAFDFAAETTTNAHDNGDHHRRIFDHERFWHQIDVAECRQRKIYPSE